MALIIRHIKENISKFKSKEDLNIYIKEFNNVFQANRKMSDEVKLTLFSIILKKGTKVIFLVSYKTFYFLERSQKCIHYSFQKKEK